MVRTRLLAFQFHPVLPLSQPANEAVKAKPCVCQHIPHRSCLAWCPACWNTANSRKGEQHFKDLGISKQANSSFCFLRLSACQLVPHIRNILGQHYNLQPNRFILFHHNFPIIALRKTALCPVPALLLGFARSIQVGVLGNNHKKSQTLLRLSRA